MPRSRTAPGPADAGQRGYTLLEVLFFLGLLSILVAVGMPSLRWTLDHLSLKRSADVARTHMQRARHLAVARRETLRMQLTAEHELLILDADDSVLERTALAGDGFLRLDSATLRPATLRYNARGHAAPGSLYLYRGDRGIRLVSNFLGRIRRERVRG